MCPHNNKLQHSVFLFYLLSVQKPLGTSTGRCLSSSTAPSVGKTRERFVCVFCVTLAEVTTATAPHYDIHVYHVLALCMLVSMVTMNDMFKITPLFTLSYNGHSIGNNHLFYKKIKNSFGAEGVVASPMTTTIHNQ